MSSTNKVLIICAVILFVAAAVIMMQNRQKAAQSGAGPSAVMAGGQMMGGGPGGPGMMGDMEKTHKYAIQTARLFGNMGRLEGTENALTKAQAKSVVAIVEPLQKMDALDETTARKAVKDLQGVLTEKQRSAISALPKEHQFKQRPQDGGPAGGPAGGPPAGGAPPMMGGPQDGGKMPGFNPLNSPKAPAGAKGMGPMQGGPGGGVEKTLAALKQKAGA